MATWIEDMFVMPIDDDRWSTQLPLFLKALEFAARKHRDQRRKDAEASPYINHPIALAHILVVAGETDLSTLCAALLHDTIEDTETTIDELAAEFGEVIGAVVMEVTDDKSMSKEARKQAQIDSQMDFMGGGYQSMDDAALKLVAKLAGEPDWDTKTVAPGGTMGVPLF